MALISIQGLSVDTRVKALSFDLHQGEVMGIIGPNGAGKSTLLNTLAGLEKFSGDIFINDEPFLSYAPTQRARLLGLQPQTVSSSWSLTVENVVALGRIPWGDREASIIQEAMDWAGVTQFAHRQINQLSGGERARVWLARVLAGKPQVLLVDEPIANLDLHYQLAVMDVLKNYAREDQSEAAQGVEGQAVIVAMHDLSLAARFCDQFCLMSQGKLVAKGSPAEVLTQSLLSDTYGIPVDVDLHRDPPVVLPK